MSSSTEIERHEGGALAIAANQTAWTPAQQAALAHMGIGDAPAEDQMVFLHHCQRTGLDPFAKQVYMIGRETDVKRKNERGATVVERGLVYTIQTGIDGFRLIGERAARRNGDTVEHDEPLWRGKPDTELDGWRDYWPADSGAPAACKYVIRVNGAPKRAIVNFHEYAQYSGKGELTSMWKKMPANQLAVRAEAQAWRKAYPADFADLHLTGDPQHYVVVDGDVDEAPRRRPQPTGSGVAGLDAALGEPPKNRQMTDTAADVVEGQVVKDTPPPAGGITGAQYQAIIDGLNVLFPDGDHDTEADDQRARRDYVTTAIDGRAVKNLRDLTAEEADQLLVTIAADTAREETDQGQL